MKDFNKLKRVVRRDLDVRASDKTHDRIRDLVLNAHRPGNRTGSVLTRIISRSHIMKGPISKATFAAVAVAALVIGLSQLDNSSSGVAWGEVARQVEANRGAIWRSRGTDSQNPAEDFPKAYRMYSRSPEHYRLDWYQADTLVRTVHNNLDTKTMVWLAHDENVFTKTPISDGDVQSMQSGIMRPEDMVNGVLSSDYRELTPQNINGVPCEGIETTDPNIVGFGFPVKSFVGRLWVSIETNYPVLAEGEISAGEDGSVKKTFTMDQFQWNVEFSESQRQIDIPSDYRFMEF
jgi:hypothetical protein